ncbi:MAG TPA: polysaccharide biosynthesis protein, partial [Castellaniella sp.]|nr:polysaccharide biosynthesis protein [Castellaniella sp.]
MNIRSLLVFAFDLLMVVVAWVASFLLRFNLDWPGAFRDEIVYGALILLPVQLLACRWAGLYRGMWSFASLPDLRRLVKAVLVSVVAVLLLTMYSKPFLLIPRSMAVLYPLLLLVFMGGGRIAGRMWKERPSIQGPHK